MIKHGDKIYVVSKSPTANGKLWGFVVIYDKFSHIATDDGRNVYRGYACVGSKMTAGHSTMFNTKYNYIAKYNNGDPGGKYFSLDMHGIITYTDDDFEK